MTSAQLVRLASRAALVIVVLLQGCVASTPRPPVTPEAPELAGIWSVAGEDAQGRYEGLAEVRPQTPSGYAVQRLVTYARPVEDGRTLQWAFRASATPLDRRGGVAHVHATFENRDFVASRGDLSRTVRGGPVETAGSLSFSSGRWHFRLAGGDVRIDEDWSGMATTHTQTTATHSSRPGWTICGSIGLREATATSRDTSERIRLSAWHARQE